MELFYCVGMLLRLLRKKKKNSLLGPTQQRAGLADAGYHCCTWMLMMLNIWSYIILSYYILYTEYVHKCTFNAIVLVHVDFFKKRWVVSKMAQLERIWQGIHQSPAGHDQCEISARSGPNFWFDDPTKLEVWRFIQEYWQKEIRFFFCLHKNMSRIFF